MVTLGEWAELCPTPERGRTYRGVHQPEPTKPGQAVTGMMIGKRDGAHVDLFDAGTGNTYRVRVDSLSCPITAA